MNYKKKTPLDFIRKTTENRDSNGFLSVKWIIRAVIAVLLFLGVIYYLAEMDKPHNLTAVNYLIRKTPLHSGIMSLMGDKTILMLGVDSNGRHSDPFYGTRSDTIILVNVHRSGKWVNAISIPRDSKVYLANGRGIDKINSAHAFGGPELALKTVEETFGLHIDNYIVVDYAGVKDFVRAINGVPMNVEKRMYYRDKTAGLLIDLYPGEQILDADGAEGYLRFRHDSQGDIGRVKRQQRFLKAVINKLSTARTVLKVPELYGILSKNIKTDLNLFEISKLFNIASKIKPEDIKTATLPGSPSKYGEISYWILDAKKTQQLIDRFIYRTDSPD